MEGKANLNKTNLDNTDKETITLSYFVKECGDEETAEQIKSEFDLIVEKHGGDVHKRELEVTTSSTNSTE